MKRLRELDFLRGIAIVLVLFRHKYAFSFTQNIGWIGVDLFFVLSGFLVSGLLFKEYLEFGEIQPKNFLIRRGFKIYPIYYLFYILYLIPLLTNGDLNVMKFLSEMMFLQNYISGFGYAYAASWSLAVEEHFYFGFSLLLWLGLKYGMIKLKKNDDIKNSISSFEILIILLMVFCLVFRIYNNMDIHAKWTKLFTMTHLRIDSLLAGVLIAYLYYFRKVYLEKKFMSNKYFLYAIAFLGIAWTPFIDNPVASFFVKTFGFTFLYFSFGVLLIYFLLDNEINKKLNKLFSETVINAVSKIGYCSFSIYIIHSFVNISIDNMLKYNNLYLNHYFNFLLTSLLSIILGMFMTYKIESYFLKMRNKYYPSRV